MPGKTTTYIGLGSNLGYRQGHINTALKMLNDLGTVELIRVSDFIETKPLAGADQPDYINAVVELETPLAAHNLLGELVRIEIALGRAPAEKWAPRTIDLDLLVFGAEKISTPELTVPHRQMHMRSFVLRGLCQLNPELVHPVLGEPVTELAGRLNGCDFIIRPDLPQLVSVAGIIGVGKTTLAEKLAAALSAELLREPYDTNPFMPEVYAGKKELALDSQFYFLTHRVEQLDPGRLRPGWVAVTDYIFDKELIYGKRLLDARQFDVYERAFGPLAKTVAGSVLVVYLNDSPQNCLDRIHRRNRPYEQRIQLDFLEKLAGDYDRLFQDWRQSPLIRLSATKFDCASESDASHLARQIRHYIA